MRQILRQIKFCRATYANGRATESLCSATKAISHTIKQLLHQYHKILYWLCLLEYCTQPIFRGIDAITVNYLFSRARVLKTLFNIQAGEGSCLDDA